MKCPRCGGDSRIIETRQLQNGEKRRRHQCSSGHKFTTRGSGDDLRIAPAKNPARSSLLVRPGRKLQEVAKPAWFALHGALFKEKRNENDV